MLHWALLFLAILPLITCCPSKESLHPCTCEWPDVDGSSYVTCSDLDNEQDLINAANAISGKQNVYSFTIINSAFTFIPHDAFMGSMFAELDIRDSSLRALTDTDEAFVGMEDHLEILLMTDTNLMAEWDWSIFRNLNKLMRLDIVSGTLENIEDLEKYNISSIRDINFERNAISHIHDRAFASFIDLQFIGLSNNLVDTVKRSMFPDPANMLMSIDLGYNKIEILPPDLFINMPVLESISINKNKILVLNEKTFAPVWEQLQAFTAMGNELRCDCRLTWILGKRIPEQMRATCSQPQHVKGRGLDTLKSKDLWCFV